MCLSPITFRNNKGKVVTVPCGHCLECVKAYQNGWSIRFEDEMKYWRYHYFVTLTYSDERIEYLPVILRDDAERAKLNRLLQDNAVSRLSDCRYAKSSYDYARCGDYTVRNVPVFNSKHLQLYIKRIRKALATAGFADRDAFAYYACQEYGDNTYRPHYHMLVFSNIRFEVLKSVFVGKWADFGAKDVSSQYYKNRACDFQAVVSPQGVARYVSKYITKPSVFESPFVSLGYVPRPRRFSSKGIGRRLRDSVQCDVKAFYERNNVYLDEKMMIDGVLPLDKLTRDFYVDLDSRFYYTRTSPKYGPYNTRMPRYIIDSCFPKAYFAQNDEVVDLQGRPKLSKKYVVRKDSENAVARGYHAYRVSLADDRDNEWILEYLTVHPSADTTEAYIALAAYKEADLALREQNCMRHFAQYYARKHHCSQSLAV